MTPTLFIVGTPIGNLGDFSPRAVEILKKVDFIAAEDTRHFSKIAQKFEIKTPKISFHAHSNPEKILEKLRGGAAVALVSDAGMPGISDPGAALVAAVAAENFPVSPIPGPTAFVAALCASGLPTDRFEFFGFLPQKKGRKTFFQNLEKRDHTAVFYESTHRIKKCLFQIAEFLPDRKIVVAREITKIHEEFLRGTAAEIARIFEKFPEKQKGEFVILVAGKKFKENF